VTDAERPTCAVGIVSHGRPTQLRALLQSLTRPAPSPWTEVIVLEDGGVASPIEGALPEVPLTHLVLPKRVFVTRAKNLVLERVTAPFVAFIDDDNIVPPGSLEGALATLAGRPRMGALMPSVLYSRDPELVWVYACPFQPGHWDFELIGRNEPRVREREGPILSTDALPNAAVFRTEALRQVGGWSNGLPINSSGDLCQRLKAAGWEAGADTGHFLLHDVETPDQIAYWAAHMADPERRYYEAHDWFVSRRRFHAGEGWFLPRALYQYQRVFATTLLGIFLHPRTRPQAPRLLVSYGRGCAAGMRDAAQDPSATRRSGTISG
jgi:hypothetical protein